MLLFCVICSCIYFFFFFNDTATTEIYTLSLHDALPISPRHPAKCGIPGCWPRARDRKSTRLNSSHTVISYAVFCLKKKKNKRTMKLDIKQQKAIDASIAQNSC